MLSNQRQIIEQAKFAYAHLGKACQTIRRTCWWYKVSKLSNKKDELKQIDDIFPQKNDEGFD